MCQAKIKYILVNIYAEKLTFTQKNISFMKECKNFRVDWAIIKNVPAKSANYKAVIIYKNFRLIDSRHNKIFRQKL